MHLSKDFVNEMRESLLYDVDFIITQNSQMKEHALSLTNLVAGWDLDERVLVRPGALSPGNQALFRRSDLNYREQLRQERGIKREDLVIVNTGGVWSWTDIDTFLIALVAHFRQNPNSPIRFIQAGLRQAFLQDHDEIVSKVLELAQQNQDLFDGHHIRIITDWDEATRQVDEIMLIADVGLNVNKRSIEADQAMRQRFIDYVDAGIPVLHTADAGIVLSPHREACVFVDADSVESYVQALNNLSENPTLLPSDGTMAAVRRNYEAASNVADLLETIEAKSVLPQKAREKLLNNYRDLTSFREVERRRSGGVLNLHQANGRTLTLQEVEESGRLQLALLKRTLKRRIRTKTARLRNLLSRTKA